MFHKLPPVNVSEFICSPVYLAFFSCSVFSEWHKSLCNVFQCNSSFPILFETTKKCDYESMNQYTNHLECYYKCGALHMKQIHWLLLLLLAFFPKVCLMKLKNEMLLNVVVVVTSFNMLIVWFTFYSTVLCCVQFQTTEPLHYNDNLLIKIAKHARWYDWLNDAHSICIYPNNDHFALSLSFFFFISYQTRNNLKYVCVSISYDY